MPKQENLTMLSNKAPATDAAVSFPSAETTRTQRLRTGLGASDASVEDAGRVRMGAGLMRY